MSAAARFTFRLASGETVGPLAVHGSGGPIGFDRGVKQRTELLIKRANAGRTMGIYEPMPGYARTYRHEAAGDFDERLIDLRGAELVTVAP